MALSIFERNALEMLVLEILSRGNFHANGISTILEERSGGKLVIQEGVLYPLLYRMEERRYITGEEVPVVTKQGRLRYRMVYHIAQEGHNRLEQLKREYSEAAATIEKVLQSSSI